MMHHPAVCAHRSFAFTLSYEDMLRWCFSQSKWQTEQWQLWVVIMPSFTSCGHLKRKVFYLVQSIRHTYTPLLNVAHLSNASFRQCSWYTLSLQITDTFRLHLWLAEVVYGTYEYVQSLLKVAIHGGGGATRPDLGRAVQFEGHWIARPNPGRQRAGGAAGAGAEWGSNRSAESGNRGAGKLW